MQEHGPCANTGSVRVPRTDLARLRPRAHSRQPSPANHTRVSCPQHREYDIVPAWDLFLHDVIRTRAQVFPTDRTC